MSDEQSQPFFPTDQRPDEPPASTAGAPGVEGPRYWGPEQPAQPQMSQPPSGQSPWSQPQYGQSAYGQSAYGQPAYGQPAYGQSAYGQPAYGQPAYGQPAYGQPPYTPPAYGQDPYAQPAYGQPPYGPFEPTGYAGGYPEPPKRTKRTLVIVLGVIAAVIAIVVAGGVVLYRKSGTPAGPRRTLAIPARSGIYSALTGASGSRLAQALQQQFAISAPTFKNAKVGIFTVTGQAQPALVLLGLSAQGNPSFARELRLHSERAEAKSVFASAHATQVADYPAGSLGGILQCGSIQAVAGTAPLCLWVDKSTLGLILATAGQSERGLAADSLALREDTEH